MTDGYTIVWQPSGKIGSGIFQGLEYDEWGFSKVWNKTDRVLQALENMVKAMNRPWLQKISGAALAAALFVAGQGHAAGSGWRVIPEDATYPTDDIIVAYCAVTDPAYSLPVDTTNTDCTAAFQAALDDASAAGGGTVFVPEGEYRIDGTLTIKSNVTLRGRWREITASQPASGTILALYSTGSNAVVNLGSSGCGVRDLTFWHPEQDASNPTNYPFVIRGDGGQTTIENITLVNAYNGIDMSKASMCCLRGIYGSPLKVGLTADKSYAVSRYISIHFSPDYWAWSGLAGSPAAGGAHETYIRGNGVGINIKEMDGFHLMYSSVSGYWKGLLFQAGVTGDNPHGSVAYTTVTNCDYAVHLEDEKGIGMLHCTFQASEIAVWPQQNSASLNTCTIESDGYAFYSAENEDVTLVNCTWTGAVDLGSGTLTDLSYAPVPDFNTVYDKVRKPLKTDLFNVKDYGAVGDGAADDTAAVQAAVAAANSNGGGIVLVPDGEYRMTGNLALAAGVELRGNSGGRHIASAKSNQQLGSLLLIETGAGDANGTPFITMGDYCGLRGIAFHYSNQVWEDYFIEFPFMVQANGVKNYIIDCFASNPYQGAELNGDDHLVEFTFFGGLRRTYRANHCSGGRIQYCHIKPDFWRNIWLWGPGGNPKDNLGKFKWNVTKEGLEVFYLNGCTNYSISSIFNHASHTFFTADNSSGQTLCVGGEQLQQGYAFKNGAESFDMLKAGCNINSIGDYTGTYGIKTFPGFKGQARFFSSSVGGTAMDAWAAEDGLLYLQQCSIGGSSGRGAKAFTCGTNGTMSLEGCSSGNYLGFENLGSVVMTNCSFSDGFVYSAAGDYVDDNVINSTYILSDSNQDPVRDYGLVLDTNNIVMEDALIMAQDHPAGASDDARRVKAARSTNDVFLLDVTEPDYADGKNKSVTIKAYFLMFSNSTAEVYYDSASGEKLGKAYSHNQSANWKEVSFSVSDARFGGTEDIRIAVTNDALLAYVVVKSSRMPGDPIHTGSIVLDNNDGANTVTKTWTVSDLNSTNPPVSGSAASATGALSAAGQLGISESFSLTASSVIGWTTADAQAAVSGGTLSNYLAGLSPGRVDGMSSGQLGSDSGSVYSNDASNTLGKGSLEALVYTVDTSNLTSGKLYLLNVAFQIYTANDRTDFIIYDASENTVIEEQWNTNYNGDDSVSGDWLLEDGDKIIIGTGASNGSNEFRVNTLRLDVISNLSGYDAWVVWYGGAGLLGTSTNDYDGDGLVNLGEYALNGNPTNDLDAGEAPILQHGGGTLIYIHPQRSDDTNLVYSVETCTNLVSGTWTNAGYIVSGTNVTEATLDYVTNAVPTDLWNAYFRLKVEK